MSTYATHGADFDADDYAEARAEARWERRQRARTCPECRLSGGAHLPGCPDDDGPEAPAADDDTDEEC